MLLVAAREAQDAGLAVTELHTSWLDTPPEEAMIQARVEADQEAERSEQVNDAVEKILNALRSNGYERALRIEDVKMFGVEPGPGGTAAAPVNTADAGAEDRDRQG